MGRAAEGRAGCRAHRTDHFVLKRRAPDLALAIAAQVDFIVSGDHDLLILDTQKQIERLHQLPKTQQTIVMQKLDGVLAQSSH